MSNYKSNLINLKMQENKKSGFLRGKLYLAQILLGMLCGIVVTSMVFSSSFSHMDARIERIENTQRSNGEKTLVARQLLQKQMDTLLHFKYKQ